MQSATATFPCYQETATSSTTCGGLNTGNYFESLAVNSYLYANYTIPSQALSTGTLWQVKYNNASRVIINATYFYSETQLTSNFSVPASCLSSGKLQFRLRVENTVGYLQGDCYNGSGFMSVFDLNPSDLNNWGATCDATTETRWRDGSYSTGQSWELCNGNGAKDIHYWGIFEEAVFWNMNFSNPAINTSRILPATAYKNSNLSGYCNASGSDNHNVSFNFIWYKNGVANKTGRVSENNTPGIEYLINSTSGFFVKNDNITFSCQANNTFNVSSYFNSSVLAISNSAPTIDTIQILPSPATQLNNLTCNYTASDLDGDSYNVSFNWTKNGAVLAHHTVQLNVGNYSNGDNITCSAYASDGIDNGSWSTTNVLNLNDATAPSLINYLASDYDPYTYQSVIFSATITDTQSEIPTTACDFQFSKSDYDPGAGLGASFNYTSNTKNGDVVSTSLNMANFGEGDLIWERLYCHDGSNNVNQTVVNQTIIIQGAADPGSSGAGGASSGPEEKECDILIVRPRSSINSIGFSALPGDYSPWQTIVLENQETYENTYYFNTDKTLCELNQSGVKIPGKAQGENQIRCKLPDENTETFVKVDCRANDIELKINLYSDIASFLYNNPWYLALAILFVTAFVAAMYGLYQAARS